MTITPVFGSSGLKHFVASIELDGKSILAKGTSKKRAFNACIKAMVESMRVNP